MNKWLSEHTIFGIPANEPIAWVPILPIVLVGAFALGTFLGWVFK